jgi:hypothetical protein
MTCVINTYVAQTMKRNDTVLIVYIINVSVEWCLIKDKDQINLPYIV